MIELVNENIGKKEIDELIEWLKTYPRLTKGKLTVEFEKQWSEYIGCKHSLFVNSGSSANLIALATLKLCQNNKNNKIVIPALCWLTDYSPAIQLGMDIKFCDINLKDLSVDLNKLEILFKEFEPAYFMLVSVLAMSPDMDSIVNLCKKYNVILIGDHCESLGTLYKNKPLGNCGEYCSTYSLYYGHTLSTIEGGMVCTNDSNFYEKLLMMRSHGWIRDLDSNQKEKYKNQIKSNFHEFYTFFEPGFNLRSTDLQAFLGINQLKKVNDLCNKRFLLFSEYLNFLKNKIWTPKINSCSFTAGFAYPVILNEGANPEIVAEKLLLNNIQCRPLISGSMITQPLYKNFDTGQSIDDFPNTKIIDERGLYVPCHPDMSIEDVKKICKIIIGDN